MQYAHIISGGTMVHVAPHFSLCAPAYGKIGEQIFKSFIAAYDSHKTSIAPVLHTTKMSRVEDNEWAQNAGLSYIETNDDLSQFIDYLISLPDTRCIIMAAAVCDWVPYCIESPEDALDNIYTFGKNEQRLKTSGGNITLHLKPFNKMIKKIRKDRKDIFLVSFKTTAWSTTRETYLSGLKSLKSSSSNIVLANDIKNHHNLLITPEEFFYNCYDDRQKASDMLVDMITARTKLTFTRTEVVDDRFIFPQDIKENIPNNFITVLKYLIDNGAYKPLNGKTSGHFGCKVDNKSYYTISSVRKRDHNKVFEEGMCPIYGKKDNKILAGGAKPSVGEHTQQEIYRELGDKAHSIVHFHCELNDSALFPKDGIREQFGFECGSNECARNTVSGLIKLSENVYASHLSGHGPNIAFHKDAAPDEIINIINTYWDLSQKTGGNFD